MYSPSDYNIAWAAAKIRKNTMLLKQMNINWVIYFPHKSNICWVIAIWISLRYWNMRLTFDGNLESLRRSKVESKFVTSSMADKIQGWSDEGNWMKINGHKFLCKLHFLSV